MEILTYLLEHADDGRSKSFFCLSCALLPVDRLTELQEWICSLSDDLDRKARNRLVRDRLTDMADGLNITLRLRKSGSS